MNTDVVLGTLTQRYHHLKEVASNVYCATDEYQDKPYAIRYFDLSDDIASRSEDLNEYLENVLGENYFDVKLPIDLRWNNYLYFITSHEHQKDDAFLRAKSIIESDMEYARKFVIAETDLPNFLKLSSHDNILPEVPIQDLYSTWLKLLNDQQLGYMLNFNLKPPEIVRRISKGETGKPAQDTPVGNLNAAERDAISHPLQKLVKKGFRKYPRDGEFQFGSHVNLITGPNGYGKTSLLETIEFLFCGSTYRNGSAPRGTHIASSLVNSPDTLETKSTKNFSKQLKIRNLGWYGKNDVRGSSLQKSFARFNFMDTDAAIRLSVEESPEKISDDIARILLGPEAGKTTDRVQRIRDELERQLSTNQKNNRQLTQRIELLEQQRRSFNSMTKLSDTFFQQLNQSLKSMHWKDRPNKVDDMYVNTLSEKLATSNLQSNLLEESNLDDLNKQRHELESINLSLMTYVEATSNSDADLKYSSTQQEKIIHKLKLIEELQSYSGSDLLFLEQQEKEQMVTLNNLQAKLPDLQHIDLINDELFNFSLDNALSITNTNLSKISADKDGTLIRIEEYERSQSMLGSLQDQLISTATTILKSTRDKDHCPLCHTQFEQGQLMLRIASDTVSNSAPRSVELRNQLESLQKSEANLQQTKLLLTLLINYCGDEVLPTVALSLGKYKEDKLKSLDLQESLKELTTKLINYSGRGLKTNRLKDIMGFLELTEYGQNELDVLTADCNVESKRLTMEINSYKAALDDRNKQISKLAKRAGLSDSLPLATLIKTIASEKKICDQKITAVLQLSNFMDLKQNFSPNALSHQINEARDIASKFITARKQEEETSSRSQQLEKQIEDSQQELTLGKTILEHLSGARKIVLNLLSGHDSLASIKQELLKNNAATISEIFSKIHLPNEYDINIEGEVIELIHKVSGESRSLSEVSTGQRTAFALSLFLTMNKTLSNGPMVLLLDDPISHIDDVNMLSFLDYLRELAIDGKRQIFFATPNTKLASLFRHKFRFLGDNEYREIQMAR